MSDSQIVDTFQRARRNPNLAVIEGVQALKHTLRFGAEITQIVTADIKLLKELLNELAPDIEKQASEKAEEINSDSFAKLSTRPHRTKVMTIAKRRNYSLKDISETKPIIFLEDPKDLENIGAVIRVSAAADAGAVVVSGQVDIWHPAVIRGAAGLHWALPVLNVASASSFLRRQESRPKVSLDPTGKSIDGITIPKNAILIFGTERHGISQELLEQSDKIVSLPMKKRVSSLNLATSVAATLYGFVLS